MKHICPKCGWNTFIVTAHVTQDWLVDENGAYSKTLSDCDQVTHWPNADDIWVCEQCGFDAAGSVFERCKPDLAKMREYYPKGSRVMLAHMEGPYSKLIPGCLGTVVSVDDIGTIHVNWDCNSGLGVAYGVDAVRKI